MGDLFFRVPYLPIFVGLVLVGCSTVPIISPPSPEVLNAWQVRRQHLVGLRSWRLEGRFAIRTEADGWSGMLYWDQYVDGFDIRLTTLLGQGMVQLHGDPRAAVLRMSATEVYYADDVETLVYEQLGWSLPISLLRFWILGLPGPNHVKSIQLDQQGRLLQLQQAGWNINFKRYTRLDGVELPGKIFLESEDLTFRLVVDQWKLRPMLELGIRNFLVPTLRGNEKRFEAP